MRRKVIQPLLLATLLAILVACRQGPEAAPTQDVYKRQICYCKRQYHCIVNKLSPTQHCTTGEP